MEAQLLVSLSSNSELLAQGCLATLAKPSGVLVEHQGKSLGQWHWEEDKFNFTAPPCRAPQTTAATIAEAIVTTVARVKSVA
jgi:hypothetical protein